MKLRVPLVHSSLQSVADRHFGLLQLAEGMEAVTITSEPMLAGSKPEDWNPNAVYKLSLDDQKPQTQTAQQIKDMTLDEHKRVWTVWSLFIAVWSKVVPGRKLTPTLCFCICY